MERVDPAAFSQRLQQRMTKLAVGQSALARGLGVRQSTVYNWLNGTVPRGGAAVRLADVLSTTEEWLLYGEGEELIRTAVPHALQRINSLSQAVSDAQRKFVLQYLETAVALNGAPQRPKRVRRPKTNGVGAAGRSLGKRRAT